MISFDKQLENELMKLSTLEKSSFIPRSFYDKAAKGFLAGMMGPKSYKKNDWMNQDISKVTILESLKRHILEYEKGELARDPDTGISDILPFMAARIIMLIEKEYQYKLLKKALSKVPERKEQWPSIPRD